MRGVHGRILLHRHGEHERNPQDLSGGLLLPGGVFNSDRMRGRPVQQQDGGLVGRRLYR